MNDAPDHMTLTSNGPRLMGWRTRIDPHRAIDSLTLTADGSGPLTVWVKFSDADDPVEYEPHGDLSLDLYRVANGAT